MQAKSIIYLIVVIVLILVAGIGWFGLPNSEKGEEVPLRPSTSLRVNEGQALDLAFTNYNGETVRLSDIEGPLVINTWAAWCPFCVKELADFVAVQKELGHGASDRVVFIAINRAESRETAKEFTDGLGISNDLVFLLDPEDSFYRAIGGFAMPETIFVKADGTIHLHKRGPMPVEEIRQRVNELGQ